MDERTGNASSSTGGASSTDGAGPSDEALLARILAGTARATGEEFFRSVVRNLAVAVGSAYAFLAEVEPAHTRVRSLALWGRGRFLDNVGYDLRGTPCEDVIRGVMCHHPRDVQRKFPDDPMLVELAVESYLGVPLLDAQGQVLGHLAVLDTRPMSDEPRRLSIFQIFAARAAAELERLRLQRAQAESERRFRDLFDEAPIGYVYEDTQTRFVSANRAAMQILGLRPDQVANTVGRTLVAQTPENLGRLAPSLAAEQAGRELASIELELRRVSDGKPVWVQRWSRPEPDGKHTRTMIVDITDRVLAQRERNHLRQQNVYLREEIASEHNFDEIVGGSLQMRTVLDKVAQVAATDSTVLIVGETGTGKELIARALHAASRRKDKPLIKLNCAALPTGLIESELFGHEKGAFTGAVEKRVGRFALADGGTIFLDEIGDVPLDVQVRLLRVLQEREFEPVGSARTVEVDVRVVAATNRDLRQAVEEGTFRRDLYYRLAVFPIEVPPLRERHGDIGLLANWFVSRCAARMGKAIDAIDPATTRLLEQYPWPGNIRELQNLVERAVILAKDRTLRIDATLLHAGAAPASGQPAAPPRTAAENERQHILQVLDRARWRIEGEAGAAKALGLHPNTLRSRMKRFGIARPHDPS
ncbi:MAG TPA: sigma 54-interacting transcriptional regulator [Planctomycetota bacterium]